jgi:hypothetical protein
VAEMDGAGCLVSLHAVFLRLGYLRQRLNVVAMRLSLESGPLIPSLML